MEISVPSPGDRRITRAQRRLRKVLQDNVPPAQVEGQAATNGNQDGQNDLEVIEVIQNGRTQQPLVEDDNSDVIIIDGDDEESSAGAAWAEVEEPKKQASTAKPKSRGRQRAASVGRGVKAEKRKWEQVVGAAADEEEKKVEIILNKRTYLVGNTVEYLVKYESVPDEAWVKDSALNAPDLVKAFEDGLKNQTDAIIDEAHAATENGVVPVPVADAVDAADDGAPRGMDTVQVQAHQEQENDADIPANTDVVDDEPGENEGPAPQLQAQKSVFYESAKDFVRSVVTFALANGVLCMMAAYAYPLYETFK